MNHEADWSRLEQVFDTARRLGSDRRASFLDRACANDAELREEVESLLASDAAAGFLAPPRPRALSAFVPGTSGALTGKRIGPYRVDAFVAAGGMGDVYVARRVDGQFERDVAIKVLRASVDSPAARRRFRIERETLGALHHPCIARLLDAGITPDGRPYLIMELVDGRPVDRFAADEALTEDERIALFTRVCDAVHAAHRHLVVHRDLKPSNILVTATGEPKLLDFGIAKLLGEGDPSVTRTRDARPMTPRYASPEQIRGETITTATDVYSLGVVLFELLAGRGPYGAANDDPDSHVEAHVCDREPVFPADLPADIANILAKALEKDPARRYASAQQLREDLERYREGLPVLARAATTWYRVTKFVRRHRLGVASAAALILALLAGFVGTWWQARIAADQRDRAILASAAADRERAEATRQRDRARLAERAARAKAEDARAMSEFLLGLFDDLHPARARGMVTSVRELVDRGVERLRGGLEDRPLLRGRLLVTLGELYMSIGSLPQAEDLLREALDYHERALGANSQRVAWTLRALAEVLAKQHRLDEAERHLRRALRLRIEEVGEHDVATADTRSALGDVLARGGRHDEAEEVLRRVLEIRERAWGPDDVFVGRDWNDLAKVLLARGKLAAAEEAYRRSIGILDATRGTGHQDGLLARNGLGVVLARQGRWVEAEPLFRDVFEARREIYGEVHPQIASTAGNLASVLQLQGRVREAEPLAREALETNRALFGESHPKVARSTMLLASIVAPADAERGLELALRARDLLRETLGAKHPDTLTARLNLTEFLRATNRVEEEHRVLVELRADVEERYGAGHPSIWDVTWRLGRALRELRRPGEAVALLQEARRHATEESCARELVQLDIELAAARHETGDTAGALEALGDLLDRIGASHPSRPAVEGVLAQIRAAGSRAVSAEGASPAPSDRPGTGS